MKIKPQVLHLICNFHSHFLMMETFRLLVLSIPLLLSSLFDQTVSSGNLSDLDALLHFQSDVDDDPTGMIKGSKNSNWTTEAGFCPWVGVGCGKGKQRVTSLDLSYMGLGGMLSPYIGNLSFLVILDLTNNSFRGSIPPDLGRLGRLQQLSLQSNQFEGMIPPGLSLCRNLEMMTLAVNRLHGGIPKEFSEFPRLRGLFLSFNDLKGNIPDFLGNMSTLEVIGLVKNNLTGSIPSSLFNRSSLTSVMLTLNELTGNLPDDICYRWPNIQKLLLSSNQFGGRLPSTLTRCKNLTDLSLSFNNLEGNVPWDIDQLQNLQILYLGTNKLKGTIPPTIGNMSNLQYLGLEHNHLYGNIPDKFGNLVNLTSMTLQDNFLRGSLPPGIFNISSLQSLSLMDNSFSSNLPDELNLPNLQVLFLGNCLLTGIIPSSFSNLTGLIRFDGGNNAFTGPLPMSIGNLKKLEYLALQGNQITGEEGNPKLSFLSALSNCESLQVLVLESNPLRGYIPNSIQNFSSSLQILFAPNCEIYGPIPPEMGMWKNLIFLQLTNNSLNESIPSSVGGLENLQRLYLDGNDLEGDIPDSICRLESLGELLLQENRLSGRIPDCVGDLSILSKLQLNSNNLTSTIPVSLWRLQQLQFLNLSDNYFEGELPLNIGKLTAIENMDISWNKINGSIPSTIGGLNSLMSLNFSRNIFSGSIPDSIGDLKGLDYLDLSYNDLSGTIPTSIIGLSYLRSVNFSFNQLSGKIPEGGTFMNFTAQSFLGNPLLCGSEVFHVSPCRQSKKLSKFRRFWPVYIIIPLASAIVLLIIIFVLMRRRRRGEKERSPSENVLETMPKVEHRTISYQELCASTNNFGESNLLGVGSYGSVYHGILSDGTNVAIKVLDLQVEGAMKSFDVECDILCKIRHRNLVKVISVCTNADKRILVLEYMANGSLDKLLYSNGHGLSLSQRLRIMLDIGAAVEYLHFGLMEPVVHCDLKPTNMLLDEEMVARVGDFGIAKILMENKVETWTKTLGTLGYIAPEFGTEGIVSTRGDVYSFGIMMLETFTGKRPTDEMFDEEMSLRTWVESGLLHRVTEIVDDALLSSGYRSVGSIEGVLQSILGLGLECCRENPDTRVDMKTVVLRLNKINSSLS